MELINQFKLQFKSIPDNVAFARVTVAAFASQLDYTLNELEEIKVAVSEAVTNSIVHGYNNEPQHFIELTVSLTDTGVQILVGDNGRGIADVQQAMQPAFSSEEDRMGLGFVFMQSFMDDLKVESTVGKGTSINMFKKAKLASVKPEH
jgi:stage II sporulation protein AB (anti-sigma F factor)